VIETTKLKPTPELLDKLRIGVKAEDVEYLAFVTDCWNPGVFQVRIIFKTTDCTVVAAMLGQNMREKGVIQ
jgi:hypothetical protein